MKDYVLDLPKFLKDFEAWVAVAKEAKMLIEKGLVNFDVITNETLGILLITQVVTKQK